ncbi:helix-turn-helix transcriptional regulator [Sediminibacterium sp.]|jgi:DNA-binding transcriptional regulator YiaG|uniref:helix-turn-helix domain-containing protein n=1 Tax=Sediminibacterium sp. TaxID=1917865 RepID=UPI0025F999A1|nr:helix-turn-helix transcriptional regulator [Sediminibacterium sp.]MBT9483084.1 helix-turn-helix transcriptional regulator [Sediminibacterium sp.]
MNKAISDHHVQVGLAINAYRKEKQLSISTFARLCHVRVAVLRRIEKGEVNFRLTTLVKFMRVMGKVPL